MGESNEKKITQKKIPKVFYLQKLKFQVNTFENFETVIYM